MNTCILCGRIYKHRPYKRTYSGMCIRCNHKNLIPIATAAEIVSICGGFTKTPKRYLRRIYKSLEVSGVDRNTFIQMVYMFMGHRIHSKMEKEYSLTVE